MDGLRNFFMVSVLAIVMAVAFPAAAEMDKKTGHGHSDSGHHKKSDRHTDSGHHKMKHGKDGKKGYMAGHKGKHMSGPKWKQFLTDAQKKQADIMHLNVKKSMSVLKAQKKLKKIELINLVIMDNPDTNAIHSKIDEIIEVKREIMRVRNDHMVEMRGMLTPEQRLSFDMGLLGHGDKGKGHGSKGKGHGGGHH
jgi:Spy/CpxP family protein refolding chaperone